MPPSEPHPTRLSAGGRIVIPAEFRAALGLKEGDAIDLILEDGQLRLVPRLLTVKRAKERIRRATGLIKAPSEDIAAERAAGKTE